MIHWRVLKSTIKKIYFENIQQTALPDDKVAEKLKSLRSSAISSIIK